MTSNYYNQTGTPSACCCCGTCFLCSKTAQALAASLGTLGSAFITAKLKKNPPSSPSTQPPSQPAKPSVFTAKNIAIGSVVTIVVIGAIAAGIYVVKKRNQ